MTKDIQANDTTITCTYDSTNIQETVYHIESFHLEVLFVRGNRVTYHPVDLDTHRKLMLSESIGKDFAVRIQKNKTLRFIPGDKQQFLSEAAKG